nr:hypothetical protein [Tanacetum cinerariifolium]
MKRKPQTEAQARKNMIMYLKNVAGFRLDYFKGMSYDDIRPIFEAKFNSNVDFLLKIKEQMEEEESRALQSINETPVQKAAKRRKLNEEVEDLKIHLEIMPDEDDDIYTKANPLARKVSVVKYEIIDLNNKPYYKIIQADGTHQLFISFLTLLKNFDREDLEALWNLVKERFSTSKPKNFSDDFLLTTLGAMFEKPDAHAQVWKNQRNIHGQAKVVPFEEQSEDLKKKLAKNNEAKMVLYNALPKKEHERIFMCKTAKDIWQSLSITHQGNSQVKDNKIDLLVQQYGKFTILEEESIDSGIARFNTIITSLKALDEVMENDSEIYRGKKERVKSITLKAKKESGDDETSTSRSDDKEYVMAKGKSDQKCFRCGDPNHLIGDCPKLPRNKDQKAFIRGSWSDSENDAEDKTNNKTCLMARSSNEVTLNSSYYSDNASSLDNDTMQIEYDSLCEISLKIVKKNKALKTKRDLLEKEVLVLNEKIKKLERRFDSNKASTSGTKPISFVGPSAENATDGSTIKAHGSTIPGSVSRVSDEKLTEHVFCPPMSLRLGFVITRKKLIHNRIDESKKPSLKPSLKTGLDYVTKFDAKSHEGVSLGYSQNSKAYIVLNKNTIEVKESPNVTFDESPPPTKLSPLVDGDVGEQEAIRNNTKVVNNNNQEDELIEVNEVVNIKESKNYPLDQVIGNLNQRTLRSQA